MFACNWIKTAVVSIVSGGLAGSKIGKNRYNECMELAHTKFYNGSRVLSKGEEILALHKKLNLTEISEKLIMSKILILKQLLSELKYESHEIKTMMSNIDKLPEFLKLQYIEHNLADEVNSYETNKWIKEESEKFEKLVMSKFDPSEIITEAELRENRNIEITTTNGKFNLNSTNLTPDILFKNPIKFKGKLISWIECKNYDYTGSPVCKKYTNRQLKKYTIFGNGIFIFRDTIKNNKNFYGIDDLS